MVSLPYCSEYVAGPPRASAQYAARRSVCCGWNPWLNAWLTTSSSSTRVCHALAKPQQSIATTCGFVDRLHDSLDCNLVSAVGAMYIMIIGSFIVFLLRGYEARYLQA